MYFFRDERDAIKRAVRTRATNRRLIFPTCFNTRSHTARVVYNECRATSIARSRRSILQLHSNAFAVCSAP